MERAATVVMAGALTVSDLTGPVSFDRMSVGLNTGANKQGPVAQKLINAWELRRRAAGKRFS